MIVYDAGVLIAADDDDRAVWARHRALLEHDIEPTTTAPVVAQVSRDGRRQASMRRFLRGCRTVDFVAAEAHDVGDLLRRSGTADVVDAHVVLTAVRIAATVVRTSDPEDLQLLASHATPKVAVERP